MSTSSIEYCGKCGKAKQIINWAPSQAIPNVPICVCPLDSTPPQPIASWTEEQLRAFVAQEVAKALKPPPIFTFNGNEQALREHIAKGGYPQLMFPEDAVSVFQEVPAEEVTQTFEEIEPEYSETNRKLAEM